MTAKRVAQVEWKDGVPVATRFNDPYYSLENGLEESRYVFLQGADVINRAGATQHFVIGETGFGTGLNFLATWQAWRALQLDTKLTFISAEAFPMPAEDMVMAHRNFPELEEVSAELRQAMPPPSHGYHLRHFDNGKVNLLLLYGTAEEAFTNLSASVDAWYLDGFAPAKNPEMWTDLLFREMARLSSRNASVATFTAAGFVRRGLAAHGFDMSKVPGYGRKRERLIGRFSGREETDATPVTRRPVWAETPSADMESIAIVGGGIAGASLAYSLRQRGLAPLLIENPAAHTASALPAAILTPRFVLEETPERDFFAAAFAYAVNHPVYQDHFAPHRGIRLAATTEKDRRRWQRIVRQYDWPEEWLTLDDEGLHLPKGGTVDAVELLSSLLNGIKRTSREVAQIAKNGDVWHVMDPAGQLIAKASCLILATGAATGRLLTMSNLGGDYARVALPEIRLKSGQIELIRSADLPSLPSQTLSYGGYISASLPNPTGELVRTIGTTFEEPSPGDTEPPKPNDRARGEILAAASRVIGLKLDEIETQSWTGLRATVPDHLPYAGPIPDWQDLEAACSPLARDAKSSLGRKPAMHRGLYCLTGLGSKGFQYAPLLAEYLTAMILGAPLPLPSQLVAKLHPGRGLVKNIIRRVPL